MHDASRYRTVGASYSSVEGALNNMEKRFRRQSTQKHPLPSHPERQLFDDITSTHFVNVQSEDDHGAFDLERTGQEVCQQLQHMYGFQQDNIKNILDYFIHMVGSRASRMTTSTAVKSLYFEYIGGKTANYRLWSNQKGIRSLVKKRLLKEQWDEDTESTFSMDDVWNAWNRTLSLKVSVVHLFQIW